MKKLKKHLEDYLPLEDSETGILIKWDRSTGDYGVYYEGYPVHLDALSAVFIAALKRIADATDDTNIYNPTTQKQVVKKKDEEAKELKEEEKDLPPWLRKKK